MEVNFYFLKLFLSMWQELIPIFFLDNLKASTPKMPYPRKKGTKKKQKGKNKNKREKIREEKRRELRMHELQWAVPTCLRKQTKVGHVKSLKAQIKWLWVQIKKEVRNRQKKFLCFHFILFLKIWTPSQAWMVTCALFPRQAWD